MEKYQKELDEFFKKNGWPYWSPLAQLARLFEEGGEFARVVNHLYGDKKKKDTEKEQELEDEMGDILYTLICFAKTLQASISIGQYEEVWIKLLPATKTDLAKNPDYRNCWSLHMDEFNGTIIPCVLKQLEQRFCSFVHKGKPIPKSIVYSKQTYQRVHLRLGLE